MARMAKKLLLRAGFGADGRSMLRFPRVVGMLAVLLTSLVSRSLTFSPDAVVPEKRCETCGTGASLVQGRESPAKGAVDVQELRRFLNYSVPRNS